MGKNIEQNRDSGRLIDSFRAALTVTIPCATSLQAASPDWSFLLSEKRATDHLTGIDEHTGSCLLRKNIPPLFRQEQSSHSVHHS